VRTIAVIAKLKPVIAVVIQQVVVAINPAFVQIVVAAVVQLNG